MYLPRHIAVSSAAASQAARQLTTVSAPPAAVTGITNVSNDPSNVYSETAVAANPFNTAQFMAGSNVPTQSYVAAFNTLNSGATWTQTQVTPPGAVIPTPILSADPSLTFFASNQVYYSFVSLDSGFNTHLFSEVGNPATGQFSAYNEIGAGSEPDKPLSTSYGQGVFVGYDSNPPSSPGSQPAMLASSVYSWAGHEIWDSGGDVGVDPAIMPNGSSTGTVYAAWLDYCGNTPNSVTAPCSSPNGRILIAKSTDNGGTFTRLDGNPIDLTCTMANFGTCGPTKVTDVTTGHGSILPNYGGTCAMGCAPRPVASFPSMDVDHTGGAHNGRIYITWASGAQAEQGTSTVPSTTRMHIYLSEFDPAVSVVWSTPVQIDVGNAHDAWQPALAVDQSTGNVAVSWYDRRDDTSNHLDRVYYSQSADGGVTWSTPIPVTGNMSDPEIECNGTGDYMQIVAVAGHARPVWTDLSGTTPQVWTADVNEATVPATYTSTGTTSTTRNPMGTSWKLLPGAAQDIGVGPDAFCQAGVIGTNSMSGGGGVYMWSRTSWAGPIAGGSGVRMTVNAGGLPRIVNNANGIFRLLINSSSQFYWSAMPGAGTDIASGADGSLWVIGTNGGGIFQYQPNNTWTEPYGGSAARIAIAPDGQPWVVNASNQIWCHSMTGWQLIPNGAARDIGVGADGSVWIVGTNWVGGGYGIWRFNGSCGGAGTWTNLGGAATAISVGTDGLPWVINAQGQIWERT